MPNTIFCFAPSHLSSATVALSGRPMVARVHPVPLPIHAFSISSRIGWVRPSRSSPTPVRFCFIAPLARALSASDTRITRSAIAATSSPVAPHHFFALCGILDILQPQKNEISANNNNSTHRRLQAAAAATPTTRSTAQRASTTFGDQVNNRGDQAPPAFRAAELGTQAGKTIGRAEYISKQKTHRHGG